MPHRDAESLSDHQLRLLELIEADGGAFAAMGEFRGLSPADAEAVRTMRSHRQQLAATATHPSSLGVSVDDAAAQAMLDNVASMLEQEGVLSDLHAPAAIPVSTFRVERRSLWERVGETAWPRRFAAAAAVGLLAWGAWATVSAVSSRVSDWQQRKLAEGKAGQAAPSATATATPLSVATTNGVSGDVSATAGTHDSSTAATTLVAGEADRPTVPPTMLELARQGRLVLVVRSRSPERTNRNVSGLHRSASEVLASTKLDETGQQQVMAVTASPLVRTTDFASGAGGGPSGPDLVLSSAAWRADKSLETSAMPWWVGRSGEQIAAAGLEWLQPRIAGGYLLTVRDHDKSLAILQRRLAGNRGVKVELLTLDAPAPYSTGESQLVGPEAPGWWTRPPLQWQSVRIPVLIVSQ